LNPNIPRSPLELADHAAAIQRQRVPRAIAARITELADGGLSIFEIQAAMGIPLALVRLVIRGAMK
jgi:hypothetical protein